MFNNFILMLTKSFKVFLFPGRRSLLFCWFDIGKL